MKKYMVMVSVPILVLTACAEPESDTAAVDDGFAELAAGTGPYLVTAADGAMALWYASADGTEIGGPIDLPNGAPPVRWAVVDGQVCVTFPDEMADAEDFCMVNGEIGPDGSWTVMPDQAEADAEPATMRRLDMTAATPADQVAAGAYMVDLPDGDTALVVWDDDGTSYLARNPTQATWRADGSQRCSTPAGGTETCGAPTSELGPDGSFTAEDGGQAITVRML